MIPDQRHNSLFGLKLLAVLGLAAAGQFFLSLTGSDLCLWVGLGFYAAGVFFLLRFFPVETFPASASPEPVGFKMEGVLFLFILTLGIFLRAHGANRFPEGVFVDRAEVACDALQILNNHWRPFMDALDLHVPELWIYYLAAVWFKLFGSAPEVFAYFDVFLSSAGIVLMYFVFRQWMGPLNALLAFFFLAVMRWNFVFAHQNYFQSQTVVFMGLTLIPLLYALRKHKPIGGAIAGLALGAGLYSYQSFKAFPLLVLALMLFEDFREKKLFRKNKDVWSVFWIVFVLTAAPYAAWMLHNGSFGRRESEVSVWALIHAQNSLLPLWANIREAVLLFNRSGADWNNQANFQHHRILDDITGICFVLGFFYALQRAKEKIYFMALAGLVLMGLPAVFSNCGASLGRLLGQTPFVACLCGLFLCDLWGRWKATQPSAVFKQIVLGLSLVVLAGIAFENYHTYFLIQTKVPECQNDCSWSESKAGRFIAALPPDTQVFLPSRFYGNPTVQYLTYPHGDRLHPLDPARPPHLDGFPKGSAFCFLLDEYKMGTLQFLESLYPGGRPEIFLDPLGNASLYTYLVPAPVLEKSRGPALEKGLEGFYRHTLDGKEKPFLVCWDPLLNFNFRDLPGTGTPLSVHWTGQFKAAQDGLYRMGALIPFTTSGQIEVDQKNPRSFTNSPYWEGELKKGWHRVDFEYQDPGSAVTKVSLLWKPPGQPQFSCMPNEVFGKIRN